ITIMKMDAGLDTGPILSQRAIPIASDETGQSLHDKLAQLGSELLIETLPGYVNGTIHPIPQDDSRATFAPRIDKDEGRIDWTQSAAQIERTVRAFTPWPGTFTYWDSQLLKIMAGRDVDGSAPVGAVVERNGIIAVGTGDGLFRLERVQLEGRKPTKIEDFVRGYPGFVGSQL
ncbi:MAG: methionyl-tRNA formyltransferase, partial [Phototrophicales bacterium]